MFVLDGRVYGSAITENIKVASAEVVDDLCMLVTFSTGETRLFDATEILGYEVFRPLEDKSIFENFSIEHGVLTWLDGDVDIAPEGLYLRTHEYGALLVAL